MSDNRSPDLSFENEADGLLVESSASLLDVSLRLHDYGRFTPVPAIIRHQCEQVQPELISVVTQTDDTRVPRSISTQTSTETSTVGIQVDRPSFTFEDIRDDDDKVLFYTGLTFIDAGNLYFLHLRFPLQQNNVVPTKYSS
ncbi:hypothetical protein DPMN_152638 [Dreissena polymorpha]|uniref:Uncharacterized protein n=1 Tax=Dreissena polymorpha TaxID=45954 RepID=A0A9D4FJX5_DREPO|nr:hypothetical protein DPMN_152638 [Dreissena polymorpha]